MRFKNPLIIMGELFLREYSSGFSSNCDEVIFEVQKALLNMFWEYSPSSTKLVSDWLRAESSPVYEEEIKIKIDDGIARYFTRFGGILFVCFTCGRRSLVSGTQNDIAVS